MKLKVNQYKKGCARIMIVSNVREAVYVSQYSGITPNIVKLREGARYPYGFDFTTVDKEMMKELFRLRAEYENNEDIRKEFEKDMNVDTLVYLKRMLNAMKY